MAEYSAQATWRYHNPVCIHSGPDALDRLGSLSADHRQILLVTTKGALKRGAVDLVRSRIDPASSVVVHAEVDPNPDLDMLDDATLRFRRESPSLIIGLGGGSVVDTAKILGVSIPRATERPLASVFRDNLPQVWRSRLPVIAIPTTAGTGAEVTPFATAWDWREKRKYSVSGDGVFPSFALLDPSLTGSLPRDESLYTGLDAISHALESIWNRNRNPVSLGFAVQALCLAIEALPRILAEPRDTVARRSMQEASLLSGLAISQTKTAIAHSISYPLTLRWGLPHGLACSFSLPILLRSNRTLVAEALRRNALLLDELQDFLDGLDLGQRVHSYLGGDDMLSVIGEMMTPGRADNFMGELPGGLPGLLQKAVE